MKWAAASSPSFTSYTPTWTNLTVGNGTVSAVYATSGDLVFYNIALTLGSTTSLSGNVSFSLPVNAETAFIGTVVDYYYYQGGGLVWDNSASGNYAAIPVISSSTLGRLLVLDTNNFANNVASYRSVGTTSPMTWATNDRFYVFMIYRKA